MLPWTLLTTFQHEVVSCREEMQRCLRSCGWVQRHIRHKEHFGKKTHTGVVSASFRNDFGSLQLCRVFHGGCAQQNSSPGWHRLAEVAGEKGRRFNSPSPERTAPLGSSWHRQRRTFPFQPSLSDSWSNVKSKGMNSAEMICRMKLCKACFMFFFGKSGISAF